MSDLSADRRELLRLLLMEEAAQPETFPLSFAQRGLWFLDRLQPGNPAYILPMALRLTGRLDRAALGRALDEVVRRHESLRATFAVEEGEPVQRIAPRLRLSIPLIDLRGLDEPARRAETRRLAEGEARRPFDLERGPLLRASLVWLGEDDHAVLFTLHHLVSDAWSLGVLVREVAALYAAFLQRRPSPLPELPIQYPDYVEWQREWLSGENLEKQVAWWREQLADAPTVEIPADRRRPAVQTFRGAFLNTALPAPLAERFRALCQRHGVTLFMALLALFETLLARYTGQDGVVVGTTIANRRQTELEGLIGLFVNTLALRGDLSGDPPFAELLARVRRSTLGAYAHQDLPFERVVQEVAQAREGKGRRDLSRSALFQAVFNVQNAPAGTLDLPGLTLAPLESAAEATTFDLVVNMGETGAALTATWRFNTDLFEAATVGRMIGHFETLLAGAVEDDRRRLSELPLLTAAERHQILEWAGAAEPVGFPAGTLYERFAAQAAARPEAVAVVAGDERLTYGELADRAERLAGRLRQLGAGPGTLVGLRLERSAGLIEAILGVLASGAAYVPLDPSYPAERLAFALEDSRVPLLITESGIEERGGAGVPSPDDLAYVIYTSGSTGRPKGVPVRHGNVTRLFDATAPRFGFGPDDVWTLFHSYAFDFSVWEIWGALLHGGRLVVVPLDVARSPEAFHALLRREGVTVLNQTPSAFYGLIRADEAAPPESLALRWVIFGGEALETASLAPWFDRHGDRNPRLVNMYGITETTVHVTWRELTRDDLGAGRSVIGRPISDLSLRLLDRRGQPVPVGVPGEIGVGGAGVAVGYLERPALTAERFVPDPAGDGARAYRSGDLARWLPDGGLEYLGRIDQQVKIRGYRIELGEIEAALASHPRVAEAAVAVRDEDGDRRLVAYAVPRLDGPEPDLHLGEIRSFLARTLPEPMLPSALVLLDAFPLSPSGKVDRRALPAPSADRPDLGGERVDPRTPLEATLAAVWREVLKVERVGVLDDFFELGGNSISAAVAVNRLQEELGGPVPVAALFEAPTVARLAERLGGEAQVATADWTLAPAPAEPGEDIPLSFAQERLWFLDRLDGASATYNVPSVLRLAGRLDVAALAATLTEIVRRHSVLRTTFVERAGRPVQVIAPPGLFPLPVLDLAGLPEELRAAEARRLAAAETGRPFDLERGPLIRAALLRLAGEDHVALFTLHHIVSDGWSVGVLTRELALLYGAAIEQVPAALPELPVQYADYACWQRRWLTGEVMARELAYWRETLAGAAVLELPADRPRPPVQTFRGSAHPFFLPGELIHRLTALGQAHGATLFMALLAGFVALLHRISGEGGQDDLSLGTPVAGRNRRELEGLIGFFVNTLVLRHDASGDPPFAALLDRVRQTTVAAFAHQDVPFERIVEELQPERDLSRTPLFQVLFVLQNATDEVLRLPGLSLEPFEGTGEVAAKLDLTLMLAETPAGVFARFDYNVDLFEAATLARMAAHWLRLLEGAMADPSLPLSELPLLSDAERGQLLKEWGRGPAQDVPAPVHRLIEAQAARTPDVPAAFLGLDVLSYRDLDRRANQLARALRRRGIGAEDRVGVCVERSFEALIAFLGVLKAGAAYLPLDPAYPAERLALMLEDSGATLAVVQETTRPVLETLPGFTGEAISLGSLLDPTVDESPEPLDPSDWGVDPDQPAYVIYTSGSTGRPKGAVALHRGLANFALAIAGRIGLGPGERMLQFASLSFDASALQIYPPLLAGAAVVLHPRPTELSPAELLEYCADLGVTTLDIPTAFWRQIIPELASGAVRLEAPFHTWMTGGENLATGLLQQWAGIEGLAEDARFFSSYGPTEATVTASLFEIGRREVAALPRAHATLGRVLPGCEVRLLDRSGVPVPAGVTGEIFLGGAGVTRGYLGRPDLTAAAFGPDPYGPPGARLYRTGDLARWLPDGTLEFQGRADHQVKIRGFRVELGEIEAALAHHPAVRTAVVVADAGDRGDRRLVAYAVLDPDRTGIAAPSVVTADLRAFLRESLPEHMVPSLFTFLESLPLTPSGKLDRRALPRPEVVASGADGGRPFVPPRPGVEEALAAVWARLLGAERVGGLDNFFELGGHSLLATQLVSRIREVFAVELPLRRVFEAPTLEGLAVAVDEARRERAGAALPPIRPLSPEERAAGLPLSFSQERLWFLDQLLPGRPTFNMPTSVRLTGQLDVGALESALGEIVRRHEALRTAFRSAGGQAIQVVAPPAPFRLGLADLTALPEERRRDEALRLTKEDSSRPFDLTRAPLLRALLAKVGPRDHFVVVTMHHIVSDGWSMGLFNAELARAYQAFAAGEAPSLPELPVQYADYAHWQRTYAGPALAAQMEYWRGLLGGAPTVLELPTDRPRPAVDPFRGAHHGFALPRPLTDALDRLGRESDSTLFMTLLALWATLLGRLTGQRDLTVGTPIAGRNRAEIEGLIGFFVNTLVLRTDLGGDPTLRDLIGRVRHTALDAYGNQEVPFEKLVEELQPERTLNRTPLFQSVLILQNAPAGDRVEGELRFHHVEAYNETAQFDLLLTLTDYPGDNGGLAGFLEYKPDLFDPSTAARWLGHFRTLVDAALAGPDRRLSELPLLSPEEVHQIVHTWNDTADDFGPEAGAGLHQLFAAQAARTPDAKAVLWRGGAWSYRGLAERTEALARRLSGHGVRRGSRVGIFMDPSPERVAAVLAVLQAGGAYVPLDPAYPRERLRFMLEDASVQLLLGQEKLLAGWEDPGVPVLPVERDPAAPAGGDLPPVPGPGTGPDDLAYVIYTSGSTGLPKGVMVRHASAVNTILDINRRFGIGRRDRVFAVSALSFDLSVYDLFGTLAAGAAIVLPDPSPKPDPAAWSEALARHGVTVWDSAPALLELLAGTGDRRNPSLPPSLRLAMLSGDWIPVSLPAQVRQQVPDIRIISLGGATEGSIWSILYPIGEVPPAWTAIPYGRPMVNQSFHILDPEGNPAPVGTVGELHIGGAGVVDGYLARPALTAERFVPDPFGAVGPQASARLYRTGDLGRYLPDGTIEFLGRRDSQVKVRGFRIELGEIESVILSFPGVREAVVLARQEEGKSRSDRRLVAYVVPEKGAALDADAAAALRAGLGTRLPEHMVPSALVPLDRLPLTPNGKVDRAALPAPEAARADLGAGYVPPRDSLEEQLAEMWKTLLGVERVGAFDNFFELGGHSLLATRALAAVRETFDVEIELRLLFEKPTIADLALAITGARLQQSDAGDVARLLENLEGLSDAEIEALLAGADE